MFDQVYLLKKGGEAKKMNALYFARPGVWPGQARSGQVMKRHLDLKKIHASFELSYRSYLPNFMSVRSYSP